MEAATQEFHIDGSWLDPKIQRLDGKAAASRDKVAPAELGTAGNK